MALRHAQQPGLWDYRELLKNLIFKDLKLKYRGSFLGFVWSLLNPLMMILVYSIAFRFILRIQLENYTVFLITGLLPWNFFGTAAMASTEAILANGNLIKGIRFPREILPLSTVAFQGILFLLALAVFFPAALLLHARIGWTLLAYPANFVLQLSFTFGVALGLSALTVSFRDLKHLTEVALLMLFWLTPVLYDVTMIPERFRWLFKLNPMTAYITIYQDLVYWGRWPSWKMWVLSGVWALAALVLGAWVFRRRSPRFAEEI